MGLQRLARCALALCCGVFLLIDRAAGHLVEGRIAWPEGGAWAAKTKLVLSLETGEHSYAWPRTDGQFTFSEVPEGLHLLDVIALALVYPQLRLDVRDHGSLQASLAENPNQMVVPLHLRPSGKAEYYEKRAPFDLMNFIKTPYGMMIAFGVFAVFILPRLKVDPEELAQATNQVEAPADAPALPSAGRSRRRD